MSPVGPGIRKTLSASRYSLRQGSQPPRSAKTSSASGHRARKPDKSRKAVFVPQTLLRVQTIPSSEDIPSSAVRPIRRRTKAGKRAGRTQNTLRPTCPDHVGGTHPCIGSSCQKRLREPFTRQTDRPAPHGRESRGYGAPLEVESGRPSPLPDTASDKAVTRPRSAKTSSASGHRLESRTKAGKLSLSLRSPSEFRQSLHQRTSRLLPSVLQDEEQKQKSGQVGGKIPRARLS